RFLSTKEQDVYMGDIPLMTEHGTFVINGTQRVIVSQMHRSPGVFFDRVDAKNLGEAPTFSARIIPYRGSWVDFEFDAKGHLFVRIDRKDRLPITTLLATQPCAAHEARALDPTNTKPVYGMDFAEMLAVFYNKAPVTIRGNYPVLALDATGETGDDIFGRMEIANVIRDAKTNAVLAEPTTAGTVLTVTKRTLKKWREAGVTEVLVEDEEWFLNHAIAEDVLLPNGIVIAEAGQFLSESVLETLAEHNVSDIEVLVVEEVGRKGHVIRTIEQFRHGGPRGEYMFRDATARERALSKMFRLLRGDLMAAHEVPFDLAEKFFTNMFTDKSRYDLSVVGRAKINTRLGLEGVPDTQRTLRKADFVAIVQELTQIADGMGTVDDIDHLGNRRVRSVGELLENQFRIGLMRMGRSIKERMVTVDVTKITPQELINAKPVAGAIREFFASSQLSQFMDQTNPLAEVTHKRRLSALGPGGMVRERAGFEVRDVHPTHYGRICPIETPEGPNIGLINSLACYAKVNTYGFIESPYRTVIDGHVTDEIIYVSASKEEDYLIAQANAHLDESGMLTETMVTCRKAGELTMAQPQQVELMDVSPKQVVSVAASLIPFLENDDANRALMGSNMQRQAVPLLRREAPLVGTGIEARVARDSGATVVSRTDGIVEQVDANRIVIRAAVNTDEIVKIYNLSKFQRSNQSTTINQKPLVRVGDHVKEGDVIADGSATEMGELALGQNILVAFMPWRGYNFEDSILVSERIVRDDIFTSIHIEEYEVFARDTKLGQEEITRDIPNVGEEGLSNIDDAGIVYVGATVSPGDVLVGKVTPKGESPITPEEKLLRAVFAEKASNMRDTSLRMSASGHGTVVEVRVFSRRGTQKDERSLQIEREEIHRLTIDRDDELRIHRNLYMQRLRDELNGQIVIESKRGVPLNTALTAEVLAPLSMSELEGVVVESKDINKRLGELKTQHKNARDQISRKFDRRVEKYQRGDDLAPGVMKLVKIFVAVKRKLQPGDKMAGRHGNKGIVSRVLPVESMPFLEDGTPVDMVLNPLGVPSRMNFGQIMETHLGWASVGLGKQIRRMLDSAMAANASRSEAAAETFIGSLREQLRNMYPSPAMQAHIDAMNAKELTDLAKNLRKGVPMATPVFDGISEKDITDLLDSCGLPSSGQSRLIDGETGEPFERPVTVGYIYMLKLHHLVDDKLHARSVGPYSLVTQQPLGGKAQFGGQRFGEMEVWALQAYGAAYTLQEVLTVKSDDIIGRPKIYESIIKGKTTLEAGLPESFNVLMKEIRSLGLNIEFRDG
ncbi:MAG: DNA-directed RNA polymerase subunit beta, partial [Alphaproteobacteria bacterium]|nr:DNA-directed RNA polymerase subunit beta [Alphaproteobacteria bacterium]